MSRNTSGPGADVLKAIFGDKCLSPCRLDHIYDAYVISLPFPYDPSEPRHKGLIGELKEVISALNKAAGEDIFQHTMKVLRSDADMRKLDHYIVRIKDLEDKALELDGLNHDQISRPFSQWAEEYMSGSNRHRSFMRPIRKKPDDEPEVEEEARATETSFPKVTPQALCEQLTRVTGMEWRVETKADVLCAATCGNIRHAPEALKHFNRFLARDKPGGNELRKPNSLPDTAPLALPVSYFRPFHLFRLTELEDRAWENMVSPSDNAARYEPSDEIYKPDYVHTSSKRRLGRSY